MSGSEAVAVPTTVPFAEFSASVSVAGFTVGGWFVAVIFTMRESVAARLPSVISNNTVLGSTFGAVLELR